jgi:hypothetical protein
MGKHENTLWRKFKSGTCRLLHDQRLNLAVSATLWRRETHAKTISQLCMQIHSVALPACPPHRRVANRETSKKRMAGGCAGRLGLQWLGLLGRNACQLKTRGEEKASCLSVLGRSTSAKIGTRALGINRRTSARDDQENLSGRQVPIQWIWRRFRQVLAVNTAQHPCRCGVISVVQAETASAALCNKGMGALEALGKNNHELIILHRPQLRT